MVVYQIYPRSFRDADGDGRGDLAGVAARLDHLAWLGADALWLSPINPSPMADGGYDVSDYTSVDPAFGTDAELDALIADAHARGIKVLLDLVPSHTSIEHPWFTEHPERYVWAPSDDVPNNWPANFGGSAWSRDPAGRGTYLHSYYPEQPDLDWRRDDVQQAFGEILRGWRARGVDGFRLDALQQLSKDAQLRDNPPAREPYPLPLSPALAPQQLLHSGNSDGTEAALRALRAGAGEDALLVGEVFLTTDALGAYLPHLDYAFCFELLFAPFEAAPLARAIDRGARSGQMAWVIGNHDFSRPATRFGRDAGRAMSLLTLSLGGLACVYQGDDLGLEDGPGGPSTQPPYDRFGRDPERGPMPWTDERPHHGFTDGEPWLPVVNAPGGSAETQREVGDSTLALHRDAIALHHEITAPIDAVSHDGDVLEVRRGSHRILVNCGSAELRLTRETLLASAGDGRSLPPGATAVETE